MGISVDSVLTSVEESHEGGAGVRLLLLLFSSSSSSSSASMEISFSLSSVLLGANSDVSDLDDLSDLEDFEDFDDLDRKMPAMWVIVSPLKLKVIGEDSILTVFSSVAV